MHSARPPQNISHGLSRSPLCILLGGLILALTPAPVAARSNPRLRASLLARPSVPKRPEVTVEASVKPAFASYTVPYVAFSVRARGLRDGDQVELTMEQPAADLGVTPRLGQLMGVRQALRRAQRRLPLSSMKCNIASDAFGPTQDDSVALYDTLYERYSKSPMQDALRRGQPLHLSITRQGHRSSMVVNPTVEADPDAASWIQQNNLFVTPAYRRPGASSGEAKLLGLGAFPSGALISVTNLDMQRHQMSGHTVEQRVRGKTGSAELTLPAPTSAPGCTYQMTVTLLPDQMAVTLLPGGPKKVMSFTLPNPLRAEVQRRGVDYHPMTGLIDELKDGT